MTATKNQPKERNCKRTMNVEQRNVTIRSRWSTTKREHRTFPETSRQGEARLDRKYSSRRFFGSCPSLSLLPRVVATTRRPERCPICGNGHCDKVLAVLAVGRCLFVHSVCTQRQVFVNSMKCTEKHRASQCSKCTHC